MRCDWKYGPSSQSRPSHFMPSRMPSTDSCVERSRSVSSTRRMNTPLHWRAKAHEDNTVGAAGLSSRGICYARRTLEILERFGIAARILAKGITWNEGDVYRGERRLYRFNLHAGTDHKFPSFVNLQQFYVEQYLVEK